MAGNETGMSLSRQELWEAHMALMEQVGKLWETINEIAWNCNPDDRPWTAPESARRWIWDVCTKQIGVPKDPYRDDRVRIQPQPNLRNPVVSTHETRMADPAYAALFRDFKMFASSMTEVTKIQTAGGDTYGIKTLRQGRWSVNPEPGFDDFTKEICPPGLKEELPEGATGIRSDDNFWTEALLPYRFHTLDIRDLVLVLWPGVENPVFHLDETMS